MASGTYIYPQYAHRGGEQAQLADWPPMRRSGPEPGSADMAPMRGPLGNYITAGDYVAVDGISDLPLVVTSFVKSYPLVAVAGALGAWWFFRKKKRK